MCTRSLPHSPYPPPRCLHHHPRHSVTGAPLTPQTSHHSPSLSRSLFQSRSSSHLPPVSLSVHLQEHPHCKPVEGQGFSHCHSYVSPAVLGAGRCTTDGEGAAVSLDCNSSSSSCLCSSTVTHELGQRSNLAQFPPLGDVVVSLDRYSSGGVAESCSDMTVVSLDHSERSNLGEIHQQPRSVNKILHRPSVDGTENRREHINYTYDASSTSTGAHKPLQLNFASHTTTPHLNLDSQIEGIPSLKQSSRLALREDRHLNAHPSCSVQIYTNLLTSKAPCPNLPSHQKLQNISEQGESEGDPCSDSLELDSLDHSCDQVHKAGDIPSHQNKLAEPGLLLVEKLPGEYGPSTDATLHPGTERRNNNAHKKNNIRYMMSPNVLSRATAIDQPEFSEDGSHSLPPAPNISSNSSSPSPSDTLEKASSPSHSCCALSVSDPLGSTASGYAATGESGSTSCGTDTTERERELSPDLREIQQALFQVHSKFFHPQGLLSEDHAN